MEKLLETIGWKKLGIIIVILSLLFLVMLFFSFREGEEIESRSGINTPNESQKERSNNSISKVYSTNYYDLEFPDNFEIVPEIAQPPILDYARIVGSESREISIVVFDNNQNSLDYLSTPYKNPSFTSNNFSNGFLSGLSFTGGVKDLSINQKVVLVQKGKTIIRINLTYGGLYDPEIENVFDEIVESIR